jgi:predicted nucleic acid-binding protein
MKSCPRETKAEGPDGIRPGRLDRSLLGLPGRRSPNADLALSRLRTERAVVPSLWWFELRNILVVNERRKRINESDTAIFLRDVSRLPIGIDLLPDEAAVLRLARTRKLTVYDASYLELAQRERISLATLDAELARAAGAEGVAIASEE